MMNNRRDKYDKDTLHGRYLDILGKTRITFLKNYNMKQLLYNECMYAIESKPLLSIKAVIKRLLTSYALYDVFITNSDLLLFSVVYHRQDHDDYWEKFKLLFSKYNSVQVDFLAHKSSKINLKRFGSRIVTFRRLSKELFCINEIKNRLYLASRLLEIIEFKQKLDKLKIQPKVVVCFFDGELYSNFAVQYYKNIGAITVTNQHGQPLFRSWFNDRLNQSQILNFHCDYFIAKGKFTKRQFVNADIEEKHIVVLGGLNENSSCDRNFQEIKTFGLFLDCPLLPFASESNIKLIETAEEISEKTGYYYLIKLHPYDKKDNYMKYQNLHCKTIYHTERRLTDIFSEIDFGVLHASAIYIDLISSWKKAYKYESDIYFPITENEQDLFASPDELTNKMKLWKDKSIAEKIEFLSDEQKYYNDCDGSEVRIKRFIEQLIDFEGDNI